MQFLNKIEIQGIVGNSSIQKVADTRLCRFSVVTELAYKGNDGVADTRLCRFSVVTELAYKGNDGTSIIESTWFNVSAWEGKDITNLEAITREAIVHITGRLKCNRYVDANGNDRVQYEIVAQKVDVAG